MIKLVRVPGHSKADKFARKDTMVPILSVWKRVETPSCTCAATRSLWAEVERKMSNKLLVFSKVHLAAIGGVLTDHGVLAIQAVRLNILTDANCPSCLQKDEVETFRQFLLRFAAFIWLWL